MGDLGLTVTDGKVATPVPLDASNFAQNQRRAKTAGRRLGTGASGMLPELGVWDKNSANGMTGTIASTTVLDIMTFFMRTTVGINKAEDAGGWMPKSGSPMHCIESSQRRWPDISYFAAGSAKGSCASQVQ